MVLPTDWLNDAVDAIKAPSNFSHVGLRNSGTELIGGSPAYARLAPSFGATSGGSAVANLAFNVPAGSTVNQVAFYTALSGGSPTHVESVTAETYGGQGVYNLALAVQAT